MSTFPAENYLSNAGRTEGEMKAAFEDFLASTKQLPGGLVETTLTIAAGSVTPSAASHAVDTEAAAASDELTTIDQANQDDGRLLLLHIVTASRVVVVKHAAGGAGQIVLARGVDRTLRSPTEWMLLKRTGTLWEEVLTAGSGVPTGSVQLWPVATAPIDWLLCDGSAVSRATYAALFAVIGTTYGAGDGSTTFNLPNFKGRVPTGFDAGQSEFNAIGKVGGAKTHVLSTTEMPVHAHGVADPGHVHSADGAQNAAGAGPTGLMAPGVNAAGLDGSAVNLAATGIAIHAAGGGGAHNNLSPYITLQYVIKT